MPRKSLTLTDQLAAAQRDLERQMDLVVRYRQGELIAQNECIRLQLEIKGRRLEADALRQHIAQLTEKVVELTRSAEIKES